MTTMMPPYHPGAADKPVTVTLVSAPTASRHKTVAGKALARHDTSPVPYGEPASCTDVTPPPPRTLPGATVSTARPGAPSLAVPLPHRPCRRWSRSTGARWPLVLPVCPASPVPLCLAVMSYETCAAPAAGGPAGRLAGHGSAPWR